MKHYIFHAKSMLIGLLVLISGVAKAHSARVLNASTESETVCTELSPKGTEIEDGFIEILSRLETYELGKRLFGGDKGLTALGSGFMQRAPGSTRDSHPELDTQILVVQADNHTL